MSAAQMKRIGALEQTLSERYASEWAALEKLLETWELPEDGSLRHPALEAWAELQPELVALDACTDSDSRAAAYEAWTERVFELREKHEDTPPCPVPVCPEGNPALNLEFADLVDALAESSPAPETMRLWAIVTRGHAQLTVTLYKAFGGVNARG